MQTQLYFYIKKSYLNTFPVKNSTVQFSILLLLLTLKIDSESQKPMLPLNFDEVLKENNITTRLLELAKFLTNTIPNLSIFNRILYDADYSHDVEQLEPFSDNKAKFITNLKSLKIDFNEDILGFAYQMCMEKHQMQDLCAYYTPLARVKDVIMKYLKDVKYETPVFDPFCGTGRIGISMPFASGYDYDKYAVDVANINKLLYHGIISNPFTKQDFNTLNHEEHKRDYIFTNIPFQKSANQNKALIVNLSKMVGKKAVVILPSGQFDKMANLPTTHDFTIAERLDISTFEPFTRVSTDVLLINQI